MFTLFGFRVHVQSGFVVFMLLLVAINSSEFGLWIAGSIAVFTLIHELGHAFVARHNGADAEISLGFLAGYASYVPTRPLTRVQRATISFAGPGIHIATSCAVLIALGGNPLDRSTVDDSAASYAIWWAGPVIGVLNLIPILPLDGGHIVLEGLDRVIGRPAQRVMLWFSIAVTGAGALAAFLSAEYRGFGIFIGFLLITQFQLLSAMRPPTSAWAEASVALAAGKQSRARRVMTAALSNPRHSNVPPPALEPAELRRLIDLLPQPYPFGDPTNEQLLADALIRVGRYEDAAHYAAGSYERHPNTISAATIARASAALGDQVTAIGWLRAASDAATSPSSLAMIIDRAPELIGLRHHPDVVSIRVPLP